MGALKLRTSFGDGVAASPEQSSADVARALSIELAPHFDFRCEEYGELHRVAAASAFQHPRWLAAFYDRLAPARDAEKVVVTVRDGNRLVAVLPMIRRSMSGVRLLEATDLGVSDYAAPVVAPDWTPPSALAAGIDAVLPPFDILRIRPVRQEHVEAWQALVGGEASELDFSAHATALDGSFASWRARALSPAMASQLDKKKTRFFKCPGARLRRLTDPSEIERAVVAMQALRAGRFSGDPIQQDVVRGFYAAVAADDSSRDLARTYVLQVADEALGYVFGLTWRGRFHYLLIGCDYDRHGKHSPGLVMYDGIIEDWMAEGGTVFDFTIGDEAFKADFGTEPTSMFMLTRPATWRGRLALAGFRARALLRSLSAPGK